jgi:BirA family biotin operon repressor/biotin-[acetyl-CoA-carboxylase] ligase
MDRGARLREALSTRGITPSVPVEWHAILVSTSDRLKALARGGAPEWTTVVADEQTGGRGREGRTWLSPPGGLYLSILLRPRFEGVGLVPLAAGVAVTEAVAEQGVAAELKWPNDVLVSGRKLGGILAEATSGPRGVEWVALGIGLNLSLPPQAVPPELRDLVTSLAAEGAAPLATEDSAAAVLAHLTVWYDALRSQPSAVVGAWRARSAPWWGGLVDVRTMGQVVRGRMRDIDETGALVLDLEGGGQRRVLAGEVVRLRPADTDDPAGGGRL